MLDREEFERLFLILYKKWEKWGKHTSAYGVGWDIWQEQQKKIDELEQQRDEAVEALIEHAIHYENVTSLVPKKTVFIIEKITGQTWEEIKAGKI